MPISSGGIEYAVYIRDSSFNLLALLSDYESLDYIARFNDVGEWSMVISKASPQASLLVRGNGIVVVDVDHGVVIFSGPIRTISRKGANVAQNMTVSGWDDMVWLARRKALPYTSYDTVVFADSPLRYYQLGDYSFSTTKPLTPPYTSAIAADLGSQKVNGTFPSQSSYSGIGTLFGLGLIPNDSQGGWSTGGNNNYISCGGTGLISGNNAWSIEAWIYITGNPATNAWVAMFGANTIHKGGGIYITSAGLVRASTISGDTTAGAAISTGVWHQVAATWDGTTIKCFVDGAAYGTNATPGAMTTAANPPMLIGALAGPSNYFGQASGGSVARVSYYSGALSLARITAHYNAGHAPFATAAFDTQAATLASTAIYHYVDYNLGPHAQVDRWPGDINNPLRAALTMTADPAIGSTINATARDDGLLVLLQLLANSTTPTLGFTLKQSTVGSGATGVLTFTIAAPVTRTNVVFAESLGTLGEYTYIQDESTDTWALVAGSGTGTSRAFFAGGDLTALSLFGRIEGLVNYSGTSDIVTMYYVAQDEVTHSSNDHAVTATPVEVTSMVFGVDYNLGDIITVIVDGDTVTDVIREASLALNSTDGAVWTPTIGSPDAISAETQLKDQLKQMRASSDKIGLLDAVQ